MLDAPSFAEDNRDLALIRAWEVRLAAIPVAGASRHVRDDASLLRAQLVGMERQFTVYRTDRKDYSAPGTAVINAIFTQFQHLPTAGSQQVWNDITSRLALAPAYIAAGESLVTEPGHLQGAVGAEQLAGAPDFSRPYADRRGESAADTQPFSCNSLELATRRSQRSRARKRTSMHTRPPGRRIRYGTDGL